jgi:predicted ribosome quality control (RQC) complex YloA/Tae2 family protein
MHQNNYLFLRHLSAALRQEVVGLELITCFSQEKDELVLGFASAEKEFWIKAVLTNDFSCLTFPTDFARAKKNSANLFKNLIGKKVQQLRQFENERAFSLIFDDGEHLLFKLYGNRANVILWQNHEVKQIFKNELSKDWQIDIDTLDRKIEQTEEAFLSNGIKKTFPVLGQEIVEKLHLAELSDLAQFATIKAFLKKNELSPTFYVSKENFAPCLDFFPSEHILLQTDDAIEAINAFYNAFSRTFFLEKEKQIAVKLLEKRKKQIQNYLQKAYLRLEEFSTQGGYEKIANLIMANLHAIPAKAKSVELFDFYEEKQINIALRDHLSAAKNAELLYKKSKNQSIEVQNLEDNIQFREIQLNKFEDYELFISQTNNIRELRKFLKDNKLVGGDAEFAEEFPFKRFEFEGFDIWVGRNAKNNDLLTQKFAHKDDLWLHARDVSGSHVIVRRHAGKTFPQSVVLKAAELAAYYSKRKHETICPVIVTTKKFVRKAKGMIEGAVLVDKEKVVMVEPKDFGA